MTQHSANPHAWGASAAFSPSQLLDALEYAITATDLDGRIVSWNRAAEELFGYPADQALGHHMRDVAPTIGPAFANIQERLRAGEAWPTEALIQQRDGSTLTISVTHTPIHSAGGELIGIASLWAASRAAAAAPHDTQLDGAAAAPAYVIAEATLRSLVESAPDGILTIDDTGRIVLANRRAEQMFGYAHGELLGQSVDLLVPERLRAAHLTHRAVYLTAPRLRPMGMGLNLYGRRKDGSEFPVEISLSPLSTAGGLLTTAIIRDVTARRAMEVRAGQLPAERSARAEAETARQAAERSVAHLTSLQAVIDVLSRALAPAAVAEAVLQRVLPEIGAAAGALILCTDDGTALELVGAAGDSNTLLGSAWRIPLDATISAAEVVRTGEPLWFASLMVAGARFPRYAQQRSEYCAGADLPLLIEGRVVGVFAVRFAENRIFDGEDRALLLAVAGQCAQALERARLYEAERLARAEVEAAVARLAFLSETSAALVASLDEREILHRLADLVVPTLADCCFFDAMTPAGQIRRVAWKHADPEQHVFFEQVQQFTPPQEFAEHPVTRALHSRTPELVPNVDDAWMQRAATNPEHLAFMRSFACQSLMTVPLVVADRVLGALTFCYTRLSGRHHGPADLALAQELARRAALAVEHARLHAETRAARAQSEAAEQRARFLAEASALLAASLDYATTLQSIMQLAVPRLADLCVVFIVDTDTSIRRVAAAHTNPAQEAILRTIQERAPIDSLGPHPVAQVIRSGQSVFNPKITETTLEAVSQNSDEQRMLRAIIPASHIIVPMIARQQVLGAISFGMSESQRTYSRADLFMAEELAHRAALAADSARLYQLAQDALQVRETFLSVAAHELKNPLAALLGNTQLLQRRMRGGATIDDRHLRSLQVVANQTSRLHKLILILLDLSRIQTGQLTIEHALVDLSALVRRVVNEVQPMLDQHTLTCSVPDEPLIVKGDGLRLEQVVQNLIANAIKYSLDGGPVTVRVEQQGATVCVVVADQGIGIPEAALPQLFDRFYRASNAAEHGITGMGIGLSVIKEIVALHAGTVSVDSVEGSGSTFTVRLPLHTSQRAHAEPRAGQERQLEQGG